MTVLDPRSDETFNALVDRRLPPRLERDARQAIADDPLATARLATWQRQSEALRALYAPIVDEPLPLPVLLRLRSVRSRLAFEPPLLRAAGIFALGLVCGMILATMLHLTF